MSRAAGTWSMVEGEGEQELARVKVNRWMGSVRIMVRFLLLVLAGVF